jgi:DNA-directed RNA polymerase subunit omega
MRHFLFGGAVRTVSLSFLFMRSDLVEQAAKIITHPPRLINVISQRVRQLNSGRAPLISLIGRAKLGQADIALLELIEGKLEVHDFIPD